MTIHIQMLQDIATHARAMADSMQAIVDDCAEQLARRKAAGESEESIMNEPFKKESAQNASASSKEGFTPYEGPTPFDEKPGSMASAAAPAATCSPATASSPEPKLTIVDLRAFVAARSTPENRPKIKAVLMKYGVKKLTELQESQYEAVKNEVAAL